MLSALGASSSRNVLVAEAAEGRPDSNAAMRVAIEERAVSNPDGTSACVTGGDSAPKVRVEAVRSVVAPGEMGLRSSSSSATDLR